MRNDEIERVLFAQSGQEFLDRAPAGLPHNIADEKQLHGPILSVKPAEHTKENDP
jgi:hypothetical protein